MKEKVRVYVVYPGGKGEIKTIDKGLEPLQKEVEGLIEHIVLSDKLEEHNIVCYGNEEAKLLGMIPNFWCVNENYGRYDLVSGTAVFIGTDEEGDDVSLEDEQINLIQEYVKASIVFPDEILCMAFGNMPRDRFKAANQEG